MVNEDNFTSFFLPDEEVLILRWSSQGGWKLLAPHNKVTEKLDSSRIHLGMLKKNIVKEDIPVFELFMRQIEYGKQEIDPSRISYAKRMTLAVRMHNVRGGIGHYRVDCFFKCGLAGEVTEILVMVHEMTQDEAYRIRLAQVFTSDRNPQIFLSQAKELLMSDPERKYAIIQFDIARFKAVNEIYGETMGDELLSYIGSSLKVLCGKEQIYVRLTADVFMIVTPYQKKEEIEQFVELLNDNLLGYKELKYQLAFGIALIEDASDGLRKYGDEAAVARQGVKGDALRYYAYFEKDMKEQIISRKFIEDNMNKALENREFVMYLQPKFSISKKVMVGAEALVRWIHPEKGMLSPLDFVPLFEQNGFVIKMDQYIWEEACKTIRFWLDKGLTPVPISVNMSRRHLKDNDFVGVLNYLVEKYQIPKHYLEVELTETVQENEVSVEIERLKENGYKLLMDDFGAGFSSLNMLKNTKFDVLKMDRGFLRNFIGSDRGQRIVEHTIRMSRDIGLDLIAEGVETEEQAIFLQDCGCDTAQGFYYAKPMPVDEFNEKWMKIRS